MLDIRCYAINFGCYKGEPCLMIRGGTIEPPRPLRKRSLSDLLRPSEEWLRNRALGRATEGTGTKEDRYPSPPLVVTTDSPEGGTWRADAIDLAALEFSTGPGAIVVLLLAGEEFGRLCPTDSVSQDAREAVSWSPDESDPDWVLNLSDVFFAPDDSASTRLAWLVGRVLTLRFVDGGTDGIAR